MSQVYQNAAQESSFSLTESHKTKLNTKYGIAAESQAITEMVQAGLLVSVSPAEVRDLLNRNDIDSGGILLRYPGAEDTFTIRLDSPVERDGKPLKYLRPAGQGNRLFIPPAVNITGPETWFTEGEFKALAGSRRGLPVVALSGVWNWRTQPEDVELRSEQVPDRDALIPDLRRDWSNKRITLVYDSDITKEHKAYPAFQRLAEQLYRQGAEQVKIITLPSLGEGKTGLDDFIICREQAGKDVVAELKMLVSRTEAYLPVADGTEEYANKILNNLLTVPAKGNEEQIKLFLNKLLPVVAALGNEAARDIMIERIYQHVKPAGITKRALQSDVKKAAGSRDGCPVEEKAAQQDILISLADGVFLFKNEFREPFARIGIDDHQEIWKCTSRDFKLWLIGRYYDETGKGPNSEALQSAINTISAKAWRSKEEHKLQNRTAEEKDSFWYDLADQQWRAVKITPAGWEVTSPPVLFQRYNHQQAQPQPSQAGDVFKLLEFVNLKDENAKILYLVSVVTSFVPDIAHIIFVIFGGEGTGKTTASKITRMVIDPSGSLTCRCYDNNREFVQYMAHNYVIILENLSGMSKNLSDTICTAVTGVGDSKRALFTNDDNIIYNFKRVFIINGINNVVTQSDLLRRSILFELSEIPENERVAEKTFWRRFEEARPVILGGIFSTLAKAMKIYPDVSLTGLYDMADYTLWGYAVAEALGLSGKNFLSAYAANRGRQVEEAVTNHPVAFATTLFMRDKTEWRGKPSDLLNELEGVADEEKIYTKAKNWPKAANSLSRRLNEAKTVLAKSGIRIDIGKSGEREILLSLADNKNTVQTVQTVQTQTAQGLQGGRYLDDIEKSDLIPPNLDDTRTVLDGIEKIPSGPEALADKHLDDMDDMGGIFATCGMDSFSFSFNLKKGEI